jgi:CDP-diglyceride synthetase
MYKKSKKRNLIFGSFLLLAGIILLLNNLQILPHYILPAYIFSWKSLLVALGVVFIITDSDKTAGIVLVIIGFYFLIPDIWNINPRESGLFWPILLIAVGLAVLFARRSR